MNEEEIQMLNHVKKTLVNKEIFISLMGAAKDNTDFTVEANTENESLVNSILAEALLNGTLRQLGLGSLITKPDSEDVENFIKTITNSVMDIAKKHMDKLSSSVSVANPVNVMADEKNHRGMVTLDLSDLDNLQNDPFFKTIPESLQKEIIMMAKEGKKNAK